MMETSVTPTRKLPAPQPPQQFDSRAFRDALGSFPTGVAIITAIGADGEPVGLTCNSFSSVSLDPPLVSWGLRLSSKNLTAFQQAKAFAINILAEDQKELSGRFASSSVTSKFEGVTWVPGHQGLPVIRDCVASFECEKFAEHVAGDHLLFLGQVVRFEQARREDSLVFYKGAYMMLTESLRELAAGGRIEAQDLLAARRLLNCMMLRLACDNGTDQDFNAIEANIAEIERCAWPQDHGRRAEASVEFFRLIAKAAHNEVLVVVSGSLSTILRHVVRAAGPSLRVRPELVTVRKQILAHLRARDAVASDLAMTHYFEQLRGSEPAANP